MTGLDTKPKDRPTWDALSDSHDLQYFNIHKSMSSVQLEQVRETWKAYRRRELSSLNIELNANGHPGQLFQIDVSDSELYPYLDPDDALDFFKCSRILDFKDGYRPKGLIHIKHSI